jgi:predicted metal-dependent hydrolase
VEVRRSTRRRRTVSAYRDGDRVIVLIPASMSRAEESEWVAKMLAKLERKAKSPKRSDADLARRAEQLNATYFGGLAVPASVRWVTNQNSRWGSCTVNEKTIRLSDRLQPMPAWVQDYVLAHELAHLLVTDHTPEFWTLVDRYPHAEKARGFLLGWSASQRLKSGEPAHDGDHPDSEDRSGEDSDGDGVD